MSATIANGSFYKTSEAAKLAGISRSTLLRWISKGVISEALYRDRRGWRLFSEDDIKKLKEVAHEIS